MINDVKLPYYVYVCTGTQTCLLYQVFIPQANSWAIYIESSFVLCLLFLCSCLFFYSCNVLICIDCYKKSVEFISS